MKWFDLGALFTPSEKTKLAAIEASATADQTNTEIRDAVEAATNSNTFDNADHTKLNGIDTGADVTGSNPPQAHGASVHTDRTRHIWLAVPHNYSGQSEFYGFALDPDTDEDVAYLFIIPQDFVSIGNIYVYYNPDGGGGNVVLDVRAVYGAVGASKSEHDDQDNGNVIATPQNLKTRFTTAGLLASAAVGDQGVIHVNRDANHASDTNTYDLVINGVLVEYVADM